LQHQDALERSANHARALDDGGDGLALTLMNTAWHRTVPNDSDVTRVNLYLGYSQSWLPTSDRNTSDPCWLAALNPEQRIIMRSYERAFSHAKPPPEKVASRPPRPTTLGPEADHSGFP
jgi:hypothetical protein